MKNLDPLLDCHGARVTFRDGAAVRTGYGLGLEGDCLSVVVGRRTYGVPLRDVVSWRPPYSGEPPDP